MTNLLEIYYKTINDQKIFLNVDVSTLSKDKQLLFLEMSKYPNSETNFSEMFLLNVYEKFITENSVKNGDIYTINTNINIDETILKAIEINKSLIGFDKIKRNLSKEDFSNYYFNILPKEEDRRKKSDISFVLHLLRYKNVDTNLFELKNIQNIIKEEKINSINTYISYLPKKEYIDTVYKEARLSLPNEKITTYVIADENDSDSIVLSNGVRVKIEQEAKVRDKVVIRNTELLGIDTSGKEIYNEWFINIKQENLFL